MLCISITSNTTKQALKDIASAEKIADIIEIRTDYISDLDLKGLLKPVKKPIIVTHRKYDEGGFLVTHESERLSILKSAIKLNADFIDIEYSSGANIINKIKSIKQNTKIILSYHNFKETPKDLDRIYSQLKKLNCDIVKIVTFANSINDNLKIFEILKNKRDLIAFCMGEYGQLSRILAPMYGSFLTYGSLAEGKESAPGQLTGKVLRDIYNVNNLNSSTKIYGLLGNPVKESKGFLIHNLAFQKLNLNKVYVNFLVEDLDSFFKNFKGFFSGLSVTMPFKIDVMKYLDFIEEDAKKINAVNTVIVRNAELGVRNKKLIGYNTDYIGAIMAIKGKTTISGKKILIIGAGGVARAIAFGIKKEGGSVIICDVKKEKAELLAKEFDAKVCKISDIGKVKCDILINATPIGMHPNIDRSSVDDDFLKKGMVVFDVVYNPLETKLIKMAKRKGCKVILGSDMFVYQAVEQFELWTGKKAPVEVMRGVVKESYRVY